MPFVAMLSDDNSCLRQSNVWRSATAEQSNVLDREVREPRELLLYHNCLLRFTVNIGSIAQGQLCVLGDVPRQNEASVLVYLSPSNDIAFDARFFEEQRHRHWKAVRVSRVDGFSINNKTNSLRRTQFQLVNYVALTVHKLMGDTFGSLSTCIYLNSQYALWLPAQVYVIVSRVRHLKNLTFVGSRYEFVSSINVRFIDYV